MFRSRWSLASIARVPTPTQALTAPIGMACEIPTLGSDKDLLQAHDTAAVSLYRQVNGGSKHHALRGSLAQLPSSPECGPAHPPALAMFLPGGDQRLRGGQMP